MGNTFLYRMPAGIAGAISRPQDLTVEPQLLDSSNLFPLTAWRQDFLREICANRCERYSVGAGGHLRSSVSDRQPAG
jgi:hypothetical protein